MRAGKGARVLFLGAKPRISPSRGLRGVIAPRPGVSAAISARSKRPASRPRRRPKARTTTLALVLAGQHRGENEAHIADALAAYEARRPRRRRRQQGRRCRQPAQSAWKHDPAGRTDAEVSRRRLLVPQARGQRQSGAGAAIRRGKPVASTAASRPRPACSRMTASTPGSRLLASRLPADLSGDVADFGAGWGYLACGDCRSAFRR